MSITMNTVSNVTATAAAANKPAANKASSDTESKAASTANTGSGAQQKIAAIQNQIKQLTNKLK